MTSNIPTALHLKSLDIPSIHKFGIGFDSIFADLNRLAQAPRGDNYPPYNIVKHDDDNYSNLQLLDLRKRISLLR